MTSGNTKSKFLRYSKSDVNIENGFRRNGVGVTIKYLLYYYFIQNENERNKKKSEVICDTVSIQFLYENRMILEKGKVCLLTLYQGLFS